MVVSFVGLGSQVKAHNERRFSVPWIAPRRGLASMSKSLRAIFRCWEFGEKLNYQGKYYNFSLMTPEFSPGRKICHCRRSPWPRSDR